MKLETNGQSAVAVAAPQLTVAEFLVESLVRGGVRHVFGVGGANIEDVFAAVQRRRPEIRAVLCKHEHGAGTAADAYSRMRGFGAVMVTSGGAAMNLVHSIAEARASAVPLLAIVGEPPTNVQGRGAFQDTSGQGGTVDAVATFRSVAKWCARVEHVDTVPQLLDEAWNVALAERPGPVVLLIAKDLQVEKIAETAFPKVRASTAVPPVESLRQATEMLSEGPVVIVAGPEVVQASAREELAALANTLDARVAVTPDARDAFDNHDGRFLGVAGAMGHASVGAALARARGCVLLGTPMPLLARIGLEEVLSEKWVLSCGREPPFVDTIHVAGELRATLTALIAALDKTLVSTEEPMPAPCSPVEEVFSSPAILAAVESALADESVVLVDAGNTGAQAAHHLRAPRGGRWLLAMGMAGMGWAYGAAIGAAHATGRRCTVLSGDGAFFMHGFEIHTAVEHGLPITYVIFNNRAHGMCLVRERLLLGGSGGYNTFRRSHLGAGLRAMFPGLVAEDCRNLEELRQALFAANRHEGPTVIAVELDAVEIPPFGPLRRAAAPGVSSVERDGS